MWGSTSAVPDGSQELSRLREAAEAGSVDALRRLGHAHVHGLLGAPRNLDAALRNLYPAAVAGDAEAAYWLGHALWHADEIDSDAAAPESSESDQRASLREELEAGRAVLAEVRALRKAAKKAKARRDAGLPTKPDHAQFDVVAAAAEQQVPLTPPPLPAPDLHQRPASTTSVAGVTVSHITTAPPAPSHTPASASAGAGEQACPPPPLPRKSLSQAHYWLMRAAQGGHADAPVALGNLYLATGGDEAARLALQWYTLAVWGSDALPPAAEVAAVVRRHADVPVWGAGQVADVAAFPPLLPAPTPASAPLHPDAAYNIATLLWEGDAASAWQHLRLAAVRGDSAAAFTAGVQWASSGPLASGSESPSAAHGPTAVRFLEVAVQGGNGAAALFLSRLYRNGGVEGSQCDLLPVDIDRARFFLRQAVQLGDAEAMFEAADAAYQGTDGQEKDLQRALQLFKAAGAAGHGKALYNAGVMTYTGQGTPADATEAFALYQAAGEAGEVQAWATVAAMYAAGDGVPRNESAAEYIRKAMLTMMQSADAELGQ